jgi:ssDNA-binding Zn-finger/Zn-ribbon topoisomerase 1
VHRILNYKAMKQTAVEWLVQTLNENIDFIPLDKWDEIRDVVQQALAMEKEQMVEAHYEVSKVKCDLCGKEWVAVRTEGLTKLECPNCGNMVNFENV